MFFFLVSEQAKKKVVLKFSRSKHIVFNNFISQSQYLDSHTDSFNIGFNNRLIIGFVYFKFQDALNFFSQVLLLPVYLQLLFHAISLT